ncbi:hypothetical protein DXX99_02845 [Ammonifex thiophilus]|uniref:Uncharacterized protein n=1 Tax=Ammonifex thiophilus TaxID=444093 RepID=A0A3D8P4V4_9THEO|nr:hypothetical protein DXX99_02845 [Ammonifex thiophilus]
MWLELARRKYLLGEVVEAKLLTKAFPFAAVAEGIKVTVSGPSGQARDLSLALYSGQGVVRFLPGETGIYRLRATLLQSGVQYIAWTYLVVEEEGEWQERKEEGVLHIAPVFHEGSFLSAPVCLRVSLGERPLAGQKCALALAPWCQEKVCQETDDEGRVWLDGRGWCYWEQEGKRFPALNFFPWGGCWLVITDCSLPSGEKVVATCTLNL